jgi:thiamine biosynthesis lipoprotein
LKQDIDAALIEVNAQLSTYQADSELSRFNSRQDLTPQPVSDALYTVLLAAQSISDLTNGAFDVTVGPLVNLWGFGPKFKPDQLPTTDEITSAKTRTGFHHLTLQVQPQQTQKAIPDLYVDLSAIAKGYGVDLVASLIEQHGYRDYMVEIGGEVRGKGKNP